MFNRFIYRREWSFSRIYRETLSRFSCAASQQGNGFSSIFIETHSRLATPPGPSMCWPARRTSGCW
ncbi:hypothetical protein ABLN67_06100 [Mycobacterium tuberculosis]